MMRQSIFRLMRGDGVALLSCSINNNLLPATIAWNDTPVFNICLFRRERAEILHLPEKLERPTDDPSSDFNQYFHGQSATNSLIPIFPVPTYLSVFYPLLWSAIERSGHRFPRQIGKEVHSRRGNRSIIAENNFPFLKHINADEWTEKFLLDIGVAGLLLGVEWGRTIQAFTACPTLQHKLSAYFSDTPTLQL